MCVSLLLSAYLPSRLTHPFLQRLAAKDIDNWEQRRVGRLKGENDGVL